MGEMRTRTFSKAVWYKKPTRSSYLKRDRLNLGWQSQVGAVSGDRWFTALKERKNAPKYDHKLSCLLRKRADICARQGPEPHYRCVTAIDKYMLSCIL